LCFIKESFRQNINHTIACTVGHHGKPKSLRTNNEAFFTSRLFRFSLWWLDIKHQRSDKHCPWQNGKIERFFGTLKERLNHYTLPSLRLEQDILQFVHWYNYVRPHYHLNGKTPAEQHLKKSANKRGKYQYFCSWNGALTGFYLPPD
jgi:transposase InsO family protein